MEGQRLRAPGSRRLAAERPPLALGRGAGSPGSWHGIAVVIDIPDPGIAAGLSLATGCPDGQYRPLHGARQPRRVGAPYLRRAASVLTAGAVAGMQRHDRSWWGDRRAARRSCPIRSVPATVTAAVVLVRRYGENRRGRAVAGLPPPRTAPPPSGTARPARRAARRRQGGPRGGR